MRSGEAARSLQAAEQSSRMASWLSQTLWLSRLARRYSQRLSAAFELGGIGRQRQQGEIVGHLEPAALLMPAGAIEYDDRVRTERDLSADLAEVQAHRLGAALWQHQAGGGAARAGQTAPNSRTEWWRLSRGAGGRVPRSAQT